MDTTIKPQIIKPTLLSIVTAIKVVTGIDIRVNTRKREIVRLKKVYYKIVKEIWGKRCSLKKQANFICTLNHATALWHLKTVDGILETEPEYQEVYDKVMVLLANNAGTKQFLSSDKEVIHKVEVLKKIEKETVYVEKLVDYHDTGIPKYIIDHLRGYSEEQLENVYQTRLIPFSKMMT